MSAAATRPASGEPQMFASYECEQGSRQLVGQRIDGEVVLSDIPAGDHGRVYLVERRVPSLSELHGIVADYCELARRLDRPPMERDWIWE